MSAPGSPQPSPGKPKWSSRMGGALRRTSTLLSIARPGTPNSEDHKDDSGSDTKSLRRSTSRGSIKSIKSIKNALTPGHHGSVSSPSPIAESPMREAAAQQQEIVGPSPLAKAATTSTSDLGAEVVKPEDMPVTSPQDQGSPEGYVPPPTTNSAAGNPGAFTDDLDELPQSKTVADPHAAPAAEVPEPVASAVEEPSKREEPDIGIEAPPLEPSDSYFDKPIAESMKSSNSFPGQHDTVVTPEFVGAVEEAAPVPAAPEPVEPSTQTGAAASYYRGDPDMPVPEPGYDDLSHLAPAAEIHQPTPASAAPAFGAAVMPNYDIPSYNIWAGSNPAASVPLAHAPEAQTDRSRQESIALPNPYSDPFADPPAGGPAITLMPAAEIYGAEPAEQRRQAAAVESHEEAKPIIVMPLPTLSELVGQNASTRTLAGSRVPQESDEQQPLLGQSTTPKYLSTHDSSTQGHAPARQTYVGTSSAFTNGHTRPRLIDLGWVEYSLPDGKVYYSHLTRKTTTDLDLRKDRYLTAVTLWMDEHENESQNVDLEGWLREAPNKAKSKKSSGWGSSKGKKQDEPVVLQRFWVDHHHRSVVREDVAERRYAGYGRDHANGHTHGSGKGKDKKAAKLVDEDQLDLEYRYWVFMESYPAHLPVSHKAKAEALDVLTWALTDQILPSNSSVPPPFGQDECQELRSVLGSFTRESEHGDNGIQTRMIARILLRVAQWRQTYFRPNKPLPTDVDSGFPSVQTQRRPFQRAVFDFLVGCICLGIPYFFMERARLAGSRVDHESGLIRGPTPTILVGACACIVAAIILSVSVTFLSLPGLDGLSRTAGMVAVLFAAFAMAATGVSILRHKADLERSISSRVGVEGLVGISRRTIALSLPLVFLAYAVIAFIVGMTLYSFRGKALDPKLPRSAFEEYTRWTVVGVLGGLLGMLTTSYLLFRR